MPRRGNPDFKGGEMGFSISGRKVTSAAMLRTVLRHSSRVCFGRRAGRRTILRAICGLFWIGFVAVPGSPSAQAWPVKPVRLVVGNAPGAVVDAGARIIANS